jgi:phage terminase large subunit-like protein
MIRQGMPENVVDGEAGYPKLFVEFGQGYKSMTPALRGLEETIKTGKLRHGNHPVLSMCAYNAVITRGTSDERKLDKVKARGRIDGMVALTMATDIALGSQPKEVDYKIFVV